MENLQSNYSQDLPRKIGFWGGAAIMVGLIIGSGIFRTPPSIANECGSPIIILSLWFLGGILAFFGALTYAELATMFPQSGGIYVYLHEAYGGWVSFIFGWTFMIIVKPLAIAAIATVFSEHLHRFCNLSYDHRITTCILIVILTGINTIDVKLGAGVAIVLTGLKILSVATIIFFGLMWMQGNTVNFVEYPAPKSLFYAIVPIMVAILWTYDGWADVASVSGEVKNPQKLLPMIFLTGTAVVILLYVAVNAVYIALVPLSEMKGVKTIAPLVMERLWGNSGSIAVTIVVMVSTLGATHSSIITGARVTYAQARSGLLFSFLGNVHPVFETPYIALWLQAILSCISVWPLQTFEKLTSGFIFTIWIFYGLAAFSLIVFRTRRPEIKASYKCWGYPFVPLIFALCAAAMTILSIVFSPKETIPWVILLLVGAPTYYLWKTLKKAVTKV